MLFHRLSQDAVADDNESGGLLLGGDTHGCVQEELMVLDRKYPSDDAHQGGTIAQSQLPSKVSAMDRAVEERLQLEAEGDDADLLGVRYSIAHQVALDLLAHRDDASGEPSQHLLHPAEESGLGRGVVAVEHVAMVGVDDHRNAGEPSGEAPDESGFGCMRV